jgi:non-specific protein-tyrosine kinase
MELKHYLAIILGRKWVIITTLIATLSIVIVAMYLATPQYQAISKIRVATAAGSASSADYMYADRLLNTYINLATSGPTLGELAERLSRSEAPVVNVETIPNTEIIQIIVEDSDPVLAADGANILADILIAQSQQLYSGAGKSTQEILGEQLAQIETELNQARQEYEKLITGSPEDAERLAAASRAVELKQETYANLLNQYEQARLKEAIRANTISLVESAAIPMTPSKPRKIFDIALGLLTGLAGGIVLAFMFENLDRTLYTNDQIEAATKSPALGNIPTIKKWQEVLLLKGGSSWGDAFRILRTQILVSNQQKPPRTILVTSAGQGEGKSMIAANLAIAFAQTVRSVILIDCDMRRSSQHKIFKFQNKLGLSSILTQIAGFDEVVQKSDIPGLSVLTSGPSPNNPVELLASNQMYALLHRLKQDFNLVLIDSPSLLAVADAAVLVPCMDSVVLVVSRGESKEQAVRAAYKQLSDLQARSIAVVVNHVEIDKMHHYY